MHGTLRTHPRMLRICFPAVQHFHIDVLTQILLGWHNTCRSGGTCVCGRFEKWLLPNANGASCPGVELLNKFKQHPDTVQEQSEADRNSHYVVARMMQWIPAQVQGLLAARRSALGAW